MPVPPRPPFVAHILSEWPEVAAGVLPQTVAGASRSEFFFLQQSTPPPALQPVFLNNEELKAKTRNQQPYIGRIQSS